MKTSKDCNIIQDLLPNYIENLTREETNTFICEHLKECSECKKILDDMQDNLKSDDEKRVKREVKYFKKYNKKLKIFKIILLIISIIIIAFLGLTFRKMIIIKDLNEKASKYVDMNNYYIKITNDSGAASTITEYYSKEDNAILLLNTTIKSTGESRKLINYYKGEKVNTYIESEEDKIALLDSNGLPNKINIITLDYGDKTWNLFQQAVATSIKNGEYNGKECYVLSLGKNSEVYVEKDTGLRIKAKEGTTVDQNGKELPMVVEYYYEFGNVSDNIFIEPNITEYKVEK